MNCVAAAETGGLTVLNIGCPHRLAFVSTNRAPPAFDLAADQPTKIVFLEVFCPKGIARLAQIEDRPTSPQAPYAASAFSNKLPMLQALPNNDKKCIQLRIAMGALTMIIYYPQPIDTYIKHLYKI